MSLGTLDALCLQSIVAGHPVTVSKDSVDRTGTTGSRDTFKTFTDGGFISEQEIQVLLPVSAFAGSTPYAEKDSITLCVDSNGVPCARENSTAEVACRVSRVSRSFAGLTYSLAAKTR
jgi:hypothetical protein